MLQNLSELSDTLYNYNFWVLEKSEFRGLNMKLHSFLHIFASSALKQLTFCEMIIDHKSSENLLYRKVFKKYTTQIFEIIK